MGDQAPLFDFLDRRKPGSTCNRVFLVREVTERAIASNIEALAGDHRRQREDRSAKALPDDENVGHDPEVLTGEERSRATEGVWNLVENEQRPMPVTGRADGLPVFG